MIELTNQFYRARFIYPETPFASLVRVYQMQFTSKATDISFSLRIFSYKNDLATMNHKKKST